MYEHVVRKGSGFSESAIEDGGAQPGLRFYDEADRDRDRGTLLVVFMPVATIDVTVSYAGGKDKYKGEGHDFGLLDAKVNTFNVGVNMTPADKVAFGANYGWDKYSSFQKSRNANPPADPAAGIPPSDYGSWFDPNRDWTLDNDEDVKNFNLYLDLLKVVQRTDIRVSYDFSDSDNSFVHGGPRIQEFNTGTALSGPSAIVYPGFTIPRPCAAGVSDCFIALPDVTNKWHRLMADAKFFFTAQAGIGLAYYYEKLDVTDFATIDSNGPNGFYSQTGTPRLDYLGGVVTGYGSRPYEGQTAFVRLLYLF
jgi:hypothetical protein